MKNLIAIILFLTLTININAGILLDLPKVVKVETTQELPGDPQNIEVTLFGNVAFLKVMDPITNTWAGLKWLAGKVRGE